MKHEFFTVEHDCNNVSAEEIPGTKLYSRRYYSITETNASNSFFTWDHHSELGHPASCFFNMVSDYPGPAWMFKKRGPYFFDQQWMLIPNDLHPGWFFVRNRGYYGGWLAATEQLGGEYYSLFVQTNWAKAHTPNTENYLFKLVENSYGGYKLVSKVKQNYVVCAGADSSIGFKSCVGLFPPPCYEYGFTLEDYPDRVVAKLHGLVLSHGTNGLLANVDLATRTTFVNNGSAYLKQEYRASRKLRESVQVTHGLSIANIYTTTAETDIEISAGFDMPLLKNLFFGASIRGHLTKVFTSQSETSSEVEDGTGIETETEFSIIQQIEVPACTLYEATSVVKFMRNITFSYALQFSLTGWAGKEILNVEELKKHVKEGVEFVRELSGEEILLQINGTIQSSFGVMTVFIGNGERILGCQ